MTVNNYQDLIDAISEAARLQEQAYNRIKRLEADHLAAVQRAAELQEEVDRLEHELEKTRRIMARRGETIRRMEEGEL